MMVKKNVMRGWKHSPPDHRDLILEPASAKLPKTFSLRGMCPRVEDQGDLGSCTANASTSAMEYLYRRRGVGQPELSRLFLYYTSRVLVEGVNAVDDSGCYLRDVARAAKRYGVALESTWKYDVGAFSIRPPAGAFAEAMNHQVKSYASVRNLAALRSSIHQGFPVVLGFSVPENMESAQCARTGIVRYPSNDEQIIGGHAVLAVAYDDTSQMICFQNSWGIGWGDHGFGYLPYRFMETGLASDCWTVRDEEMP